MTRVLVANRGEIAVRIVRAARRLGLETVALVVTGDEGSAHADLADVTVRLDGDPRAALLDVDRVVTVAREQGCDLLHPGYGLLSENPALARACAEAAVTFVGPPAQALDACGDKVRARQLALSAGVPVLRGTDGPTDAVGARDFLTGLGAGSAVVLKAVAGGGGRGQRVVIEPDEVESAFERCRSEAARSFGDGAVFAEELLGDARHVEVQVLADAGGAVVVLGDRDCSLQRRRQKVLEVAPAPGLDADLRTRMHDAARALTRAAGLVGAATHEFLVAESADQGFVYLETNPRIQVEHTVSEEVMGIDLVAAQLRIAGGETLADLGLDPECPPEPRGVAIQARVTADLLAGGAPTASRVDLPGGPGVRVDTHVRAGESISGAFDPLLAKVVVHSLDGWPAAVRSLAEALGETRLEGVRTDLEMLRALVATDAVRDATWTTTYVDDHLDELAGAGEPGPEAGDGDHGVARARHTGTVVSVEVVVGDEVRAGQPMLVLEAMKMEHVVEATCAGTVTGVAVQVGRTVHAGDVLVRLTPADDPAVEHEQEVAPDLGAVRHDLQLVLDRHRPTLDEARSEAVAKRHASGGRTARENVEDLCDEGSFVEYGALAVAAQRRRRSFEQLQVLSPADGMVCGVGEVNGDVVSDPECVVLAYDYTVMAGTQGLVNHRKTDRLLELAERRRLPVVLYAEGGGGRPGDTDTTAAASGLDTTTFATMGRLSGLVPSVGIAHGRCFAGNAALLGCCTVTIATRDASIGMGGPAMVEGGGLGVVRAEEIGPAVEQEAHGVVDVLVDDEAEATRVARAFLALLQQHQLPAGAWECADQRLLRTAVPERRTRSYDVRQVVHLLADTGTVLELRRGYGAGVVTVLARIEGRTVGVVANDPEHLGGAIDAPAADKLSRFLRLCDAFDLPVVSLCDTPGFMVGPESERTATVRRFGRLFVTGAQLRVPLACVVLRKAYGLGAMAMAGGHLHAPDLTVAWPTGEIGPMGLEGAVRLGYRRELEAIADPVARKAEHDRLLAEHYERGRAVEAATVFELDDVIDPADTRRRLVAALGAHRPDPARIPTGRLDPW